MIHESKNAWRLCTLLLARVLIFQTSILQIYHIIPLVNAHEIFSRYDLYFSAGSHFAQNLKMALLSLSLNLEAQYHTQSWTQSGATYSQEIIEMVYVEKKIINVFKNFTKILLCAMCGVCVRSSWPDCYSLKLHILQIYHIMPPIDVHEIFS